MTTEEEYQELKTEPLPISDDDRKIPSRIVHIDSVISILNKEISALEQKVSDLHYDRDCLLKRAKEVNIKEDKHYKIIEIPIYKKNRVVVDILKTQFADIYSRVKNNIEGKLVAKHIADLEKIDSFIAQSEVKAVTSDKAILAKVIPPNTEVEGYEISIVKR
jgi:predicted  nucleic acid-binding Zn-ribbon protein